MATQETDENITGYLQKIVGNNSGWIKPLYDFDVTIGRSKTAYINSSDPNVSRNHCRLKYTRDGWVIKDLGSVNGTYIDDIRVFPNTDIPLKHGCSIYFGPKNDAPEGYRFESTEHSDVNIETEQPKRHSLVKLPSPSFSRVVKRKASLMSSSPKYIGCSSKINNKNCSENDYSSDSSISSLDSLRTRIRKSNAAERKKEKKAKVCQDEVFKSEDENSVSLLNDSPIDMEVDQKIIDCSTRDNKKSNRDSDATSSSVLVQQSLLKALQRKVDDLEKSLKIKNKQFKETVKENDRLIECLKLQENSRLHLKEDFKRLLEEELMCNICTELFIKPVTLSCSHTFCKHCIIEWKKKKKQCPMCREKIESETTVLYMDNFINKAVEQFDPTAIERRLELIAKREEAEKKKPKGKKAKGRNRRSNNNNNNVPVERDINDVELLRTRISEIQSYTDDIQSYVDVIDELINERYSDSEIEDHSYGSRYGVGVCYNCGRSGHFADACTYY